MHAHFKEWLAKTGNLSQVRSGPTVSLSVVADEVGDAQIQDLIQFDQERAQVRLASPASTSHGERLQSLW